MGGILSSLKTSRSSNSNLTLSIFFVALILFLLITYLATGSVFGTEIPTNEEDDDNMFYTIISFILLIFAWIICLPVSALFLILLVIQKFI